MARGCLFPACTWLTTGNQCAIFSVMETDCTEIPRMLRRKFQLPTVEELRRRFRYDQETGELWRILDRRGGETTCNRLVGHRNSNGYLVVSVGSVTLFVHRVCWAMHHGVWPTLYLDHINGVRVDNRITNLREATCGENQWNKRCSDKNTSGVKGVEWHKGRKKWRVRFRVNGKDVHGGYFTTKEEAAEAVREARERLHGEYANHGGGLEDAVYPTAEPAPDSAPPAPDLPQSTDAVAGSSRDQAVSPVSSGGSQLHLWGSLGVH